MKTFVDENFLLKTPAAQRLYHEAAAGEPIFDYHCHLPPSDIASNRRWDNLADVWLSGDHYKWRAMRANGVDEAHITGNAEPYDKFLAWAKTLPRLIGNPLYHWSHLELLRYFDIGECLDEKSARAIWDGANDKLQKDPSLSTHGIFKKFNVHTVGTTDDPADSLEHHKKYAAGGNCATKVIPSWRPDKALNIDKTGFKSYIAQLGALQKTSIESLDALFSVLAARLDFFAAEGCRASDHAFEAPPFPNRLYDTRNAETAFKKALSSANVTEDECNAYKLCVMTFLARLYAEKGWAMQLHFAALRSVNTPALAALGPDTGYDAVHDLSMSAKLARFLDHLAERRILPKTIVYTLNPKDYYPLSTIAGSFQGGAAGKMQLGSAWWFLDHRDGMTEQLKILANTGLLSRFIGMLTDSRSFLSYPRHEYFRRILCNIIGGWVEDGEYPADFDALKGIVRDISFANARDYFSAAPSALI